MRTVSISEDEERLVELQVALANLITHGNDLEGLDRRAILKKAAAGEVLVLDVRPTEEYASAHLPHARSLPVDELKEGAWPSCPRTRLWSPTAAVRSA